MPRFFHASQKASQVQRQAVLVALFSLLLAACGSDTGSSADDKVSAKAEPKMQVSKNEASQAGAVNEGIAEAQTEPSSDTKSVPKELIALYQRSCISCHLSGAAGAPKTHDVAAWEPKLEKGMEAVLANINNGLNAMPAKGLCFDCSDEQFEALVHFMAGPAAEGP